MSRRRFALCILICNLLYPSIEAGASFCADWASPKSVGHLPLKHINEASGVVSSFRHPQRLYWMNDSGDKGFLHSTAKDGSNHTRIKIKKYRPRDVEALGLADCPQGPCILIGDIGDNRRRRKHIEIITVIEHETFPDEMDVLRRVQLSYPDGAHDAEAMVVLPSGDLLILTKELRMATLTARPTGLYKIAKVDWNRESGTPHRLTKIGELPLPTWLKHDGFVGQVVTDAAINHRRQVLGILTYNNLVEIPLAKLQDVSNATQWKRGADYSIVTLKALGQQETLTYPRDSDDLLYSSEFVPPDSPIFSMTCRRPVP